MVVKGRGSGGGNGRVHHTVSELEERPHDVLTRVEELRKDQQHAHLPTRCMRSHEAPSRSGSVRAKYYRERCDEYDHNRKPPPQVLSRFPSCRVWGPRETTVFHDFDCRAVEERSSLCELR